MESGISFNTSEDLQTMDKEVLLSCAPESQNPESTPYHSSQTVFFHNHQTQTLPKLSQGHSYEQILFGILPDASRKKQKLIPNFYSNYKLLH